MKKNRFKMNHGLNLLSVAAVAALLLFAACAGSVGVGPRANTAAPERSGSELWAQNCRRCHNFRSPSEFNDSDWDVAMFHMRVRANLTEEEYVSIRQFLKASN